VRNEMTDNKKTMKDKDFCTAVAERFSGDATATKLAPLVAEFLELLGTEHFTPMMELSVKNGESPVVFLNFWKINWRKEKATRELIVNATCSTKTAGRKLTEHFVSGGNKVTPAMCDYLYSVIGHPGSFPKLIQMLSKRAKQKSSFYDRNLIIGKNLTLLFRMVFDTLLHETFDNGAVVHLSDLGTFENSYKIGRKNATNDRPPGYFQFTPNFP
tara:strand:- start:23 stop:664 length:642 start_codon:yes stop_codon:yes gene_type:complete